MGLLDLLLILFIGVLALMGWRSGLIHESATLVGVALGLVVAGAYSERFGPFFQRWFADISVANLAAFVAVLLATWVLVLVGGRLLRGVLRTLHLGWLDSMGGMVLGLAKGLLMAEIIVLVLMALPGTRWHDAVTHSLIGSRLAEVGPSLVRVVPSVLRYWKPV